MAKIICITTGLQGILNASFELVARLKAAGHEVGYAAPREVSAQVSAQGITFFPLPQIEDQEAVGIPAFKGPLRKIKRLVYKYQHREERHQKALQQTNPEAFVDLLEKTAPDLLLIDIELHEYIFKAHARQQKYALLSQWFSLWNRPGLPYLLHDTIPGSGWRGQPWAIAWSWKMIRFNRWWTFLRKKIYSGFTDRRTILLALAKQEGFPLEYLRENYWPGPFSYDQLPVLSMTAREMEFPHEPRPNQFYIGPMVCTNRVERVAERTAAYSLEEVLEYRKKIKAALIYCSISTLHQGDVVFVEKVIKAVRKRKDWVLVIGMGGLVEEKTLDPLPGNVFAFSYVPQLQVLREANCSINHGGIHTINECIHFGVPMLVYSGKRSDQNGCAARVDFHGLGIMADKDKDGPVAIRSKIDQVMNQASFREKIQAMANYFDQYKTNARVEHIVADLLKA